MKITISICLCLSILIILTSYNTFAANAEYTLSSIAAKKYESRKKSTLTVTIGCATCVGLALTSGDRLSEEDKIFYAEVFSVSGLLFYWILKMPTKIEKEYSNVQKISNATERELLATK